jgi:Phasin protein
LSLISSPNGAICATVSRSDESGSTLCSSLSKFSLNYSVSGTGKSYGRSLRERGGTFRHCVSCPTHRTFALFGVEATEPVPLPLYLLGITENFRSMSCLLRNPDRPVFSPDFVRQFEQANEHAESVFALQKELLDTFAEMNQHWLARAKYETEFTTMMANKFVSARSMPDMTGVYQNRLGQCMQRCVEDSKHVFDDVQKLIPAGTRLTRNGNGRS